MPRPHKMTIYNGQDVAEHLFALQDGGEEQEQPQPQQGQAKTTAKPSPRDISVGAALPIRIEPPPAATQADQQAPMGAPPEAPTAPDGRQAGREPVPGKDYYPDPMPPLRGLSGLEEKVRMNKAAIREFSPVKAYDTDEKAFKDGRKTVRQLPNGQWVGVDDYEVAAAHLGDPRAIHSLADRFARSFGHDYAAGYQQALAAISISMHASGKLPEAGKLAIDQLFQEGMERERLKSELERERIREAGATERAHQQAGLIKSAQAQKIIDQGIAEGLTGEDLRRYVQGRSNLHIEDTSSGQRPPVQAAPAGGEAAPAGNAPAAGQPGGTAAALNAAAILKDVGFTPPSPAEAMLRGDSATWGAPVADPKTNTPVNFGQVVDRLSKLDSSKISDDVMDKILMAYGKIPRAQLLRDIMKAYTYNAALAGHQLEPTYSSGWNAGGRAATQPGPLPGGWHMQGDNIKSGVLTKGDKSIYYPWSGVESPLSRFWYEYTPMGAAWFQSGRDEAMAKALAASRALDTYARLYGVPSR